MDKIVVNCNFDEKESTISYKIGFVKYSLKLEKTEWGLIKGEGDD